jgi:hypothetical protein
MTFVEYLHFGFQAVPVEEMSANECHKWALEQSALAECALAAGADNHETRATLVHLLAQLLRHLRGIANLQLKLLKEHVCFCSRSAEQNLDFVGVLLQAGEQRLLEMLNFGELREVAEHVLNANGAVGLVEQLQTVGDRGTTLDHVLC